MYEERPVCRGDWIVWQHGSVRGLCGWLWVGVSDAMDAASRGNRQSKASRASNAACTPRRGLIATARPMACVSNRLMIDQDRNRLIKALLVGLLRGECGVVCAHTWWLVQPRYIRSRRILPLAGRRRSKTRDSAQARVLRFIGFFFPFSSRGIPFLLPFSSVLPAFRCCCFFPSDVVDCCCCCCWPYYPPHYNKAPFFVFLPNTPAAATTLYLYHPRNPSLLQTSEEKAHRTPTAWLPLSFPPRYGC